MSQINEQIQQVLDFWFNEEHQIYWFQQSDAFDQRIQQQFADLHQQAGQGELWQWRTTAQGRLAEILILDQFSRNLFRQQAQAFAYDAMALVLAQEMIALGDDMKLAPQQRHFAYLPFMHSESAVIHQQAVQLFQALGNEQVLDFEYRHKVIIDRFGRYPHRNAVLGRVSTAEEIAFLAMPNSSF
ncbi:MAG: DUF924 family protein [Acinetobacter sp.]|nr:DUF924 family protein [Acinetobacter sp.]